MILNRQTGFWQMRKSWMPNINEAFPSNYLKASDLKGNQAVVTIDRVEFEPVGRDREMKAVIYFIGKNKGVVLNKTNARKITEISGSALTEEWHGVAVVLYPTETEFGGEVVDCIRIKSVAKGAQKMQKMTPAPPPVAPKRQPDPEWESDPAPEMDDDGSVPF